MPRPTIKILSAYLAFIIIYYSGTSLLFFKLKKEGSNFIENLFIALGDLFFWVSAHYYLAIILLVSSVIGMIVTWRRSFQPAFKTFRAILIGTILCIIVVAILANL